MFKIENIKKGEDLIHDLYYDKLTIHLAKE